MARFADLPPEMVGNVFAFIRQTRDRKSVCLVSRTFRDLMAPILWERFESNLLTDNPQLFEALVSHQSNILANVKEFELLDGPNSEDQLSNVQQQSLITFLTALPKDKLAEF